MANELRFDGKVAIVTGAGNGLGRAHALLLASRGAKVVVNDLGGGRHGGGTSSEAADKVVAEIKAAGGEAVANYDSVENGGKIVQSAIDAFGRIDIVINNAGILRDVTFHKMTEEDWELIYRVHVLGSFRVAHAAWPHMRDQGYGRIIFTSSAAGIYGNFGQANYAMAKLGLVGLSNTLALEGKKKNVLVNTIAPLAGSRLTETVLPKELIDALKPEYVSPLVAYLCHESSTETGGLFEVGGGFFAKLRWERAEGKTVRLGREIKLEDIQKGWGAIAGFDKATHPAEINQSMGPVMANVQAGPAKGGNDLIDVDQALGYEYPAVSSSYDERDLSIYALGVGAAENPLDDKELRYVYELHGQGFAPLPTFGVVPALSALMDLAKAGKTAPGMNYGLDRLLHGEQYLELMRPLPPHGKLTHKAKVKEIWDKGKNALVVTEIRSTDESGEELLRNESTAVIRGAGGWGGERGPSSDINVPPERAPDATIEQKIPENQALLYRLSGDWNPLHADPSFATAFGFSKPILHGLCTFGYAARHVIHAFAGGDARKFKSIKVRFADSVFPGETVVTEMWKENDERIVFRCKVKERDKVVISNAAITLWKEIPQPKAKPAAAAAAAPAKAAEDPAGDVFIGIRDYVEKNPAVVEKVKTIFQFELKGPDATWTIDLKNGKGAVFPGAGADKADTVLEIASSDWLAMATGQADPQKLYFEGKLKISGNVMASQKLGFMKKIDPEQAKAAIAAHKAKSAGGAVAAPAAAAPAKAAEDPAGDVFIGIRDYVEKNPAVVEKVKTIFQFELKGPDATWTIDLKNGKGAVFPGAGADKADTVLEIASSDWLAMATGQADPQKLYFEGKLKISGNVMASQKLGFMKKIDPEQAKAAIAAHKAKAASGEVKVEAAPQAAAAPKGPGAAAVFDALKERLVKSPELAKEVDAVIEFRLTEGDWHVDFTGGKTTVAVGRATKPAAVLTLSTEDFVAFVAGKEQDARLFQTGRLRVDGDVRIASNRLHFLKGLLG
ncbi:peroxisomal multifunctional enzyme type 2 [Polyangium sorediatum]|uniref:SDR family NAD(P)-dependent oxidoreductase n=1 Tax=Polyangium sorediatum TaxID=889274 RepID=A0ABT6P4D0_9BACT|nr:peroxisomal multifunctional enzyme type 2 [Polyangium sorediatum]MDI1435471.1 SDR family NAD(P)-dependent oxidoreductase [Polyangium sorediatum]